jgi:antitoxin MazE
MTIQIKKWGNSSAVRIPADVMAAANLSVDDAVSIREEEGRIVIEPAAKIRFTLDELLRGITPAMLHEETDWGSPMGKEAW